MKKIACIIAAVAVCLIAVLAMDLSTDKSDVVVYTSMEDFRMNKLNEMLKSEFPDLNIDVQYLTSGTNASKLLAEGAASEADIIMDIDYGYLSSLTNVLADVSEFNDGQFIDNFVHGSGKFYPLTKCAVGIVVNTDILNKHSLPIPTSYEDLTNPIYKGRISMPSPKASGTAYAFLHGMVDLLGEDKAYDYFDRLDPNIIQYTSSGSGPINNLVRGECAIGIGMIFQAVKEINAGGSLKVLEFSEGTPYLLTGQGIVKGKETKKGVKEVFKFILDDFSRYDKKHFIPEQIFNEQEPSIIENYPNIIDMAMSDNTVEIKERLLGKWKY